MADFKCFMADNAIKAENKKYIASQRFVGEDKQPVEWELRVVPNDEVERITKSCRKKEFNRATRETSYTTDPNKFNLALVCASVVYPPLDNAQLQDSYKVVGAEALVKAMLTPGELSDLVSAVSEVCGYQTDMADKVRTAKN